MRFKNYTWPHNPEIYAVERRRRLAVHPVPYGGCVIQDLGRTYRVLRGEGVFAGPGAYQQFQQLAEVFQEEGAGLLVHPIWQTVEEEPLPDYVRYSFEFWEDWDGYRAGLTAVPGAAASPEEPPQTETGDMEERCTVRKGDTLWGIAQRHGVSLTALIAANPQIKNPNLIYPGDEVNIP